MELVCCGSWESYDKTLAPTSYVVSTVKPTGEWACDSLSPSMRVYHLHIFCDPNVS